MSEETSPAAAKSEGTWAIVGKVLALITGFATLLVIYSQINPKGPSLTARCSVVQVDRYLRKGFDDALEQFKKFEEANAKNKVKRRDDVGISLENAIMMAGIAQPVRSVQALRCRITNDGTEPANDATLLLPGIPLLVIVNGKNFPVPDTPAVALKSVPAGPATEVEVFLQETYWSSDERVFVNYHGGKGRVLMSRETFGFWDDVFGVWSVFVFVIGAWTLFLILMAVVVAGARKAQKKKDREEKDKKEKAESKP